MSRATAPRMKLKPPALAAALAAGLLLTAAVLGPDLALRLFLDRLLPRLTGLAVTCEQARADIWTRGLTLEGLTLAGEDLGRLTFDLVAVSDFKPLNLLKARPGLGLAGALNLENIRWERGDWTLTCPSLLVEKLKRPGASADLPFHRLAGFDLAGEGPGFSSASKFKTHLSIRDSASELTGLEFQASTETGLWAGEVRSLRLDDLKTALDRWEQSEGQLFSLIPELLHLRMDSGYLALDDRTVLLVKTARPEAKFLFTKFSPEAVSYNYYLEMTFTPSSLAPADIFWAKLAGLTGEPLDLELYMDLTIDPRDRAFQLRSLSLDGPTLGRLDLAAEFSGLGPGGNSLSDTALTALYPATIHSLSLAFQDQGLIPGYYAWLAEVGGWDQAEVPTRIKADLTPLFLALAEEGRLTSLPALAEAAEAFLDQPENIIISAEPARPLALARLVKMDRYDIIKRLTMTLTVNDQPPVALDVAPEAGP